MVAFLTLRKKFLQAIMRYYHDKKNGLIFTSAGNNGQVLNYPQTSYLNVVSAMEKTDKGLMLASKASMECSILTTETASHSQHLISDQLLWTRWQTCGCLRHLVLKPDRSWDRITHLGTEPRIEEHRR